MSQADQLWTQQLPGQLWTVDTIEQYVQVSEGKSEIGCRTSFGTTYNGF